MTHRRDRPYACKDLEVGSVVRWRSLPWRVDRCDMVDEANWTDAERDALSAWKLDRLEKQRTGVYVVDLMSMALEDYSPYRIKLDPVEGFDHPAYAESVNEKGYVILRGSGRIGWRFDWYDTTGETRDWEYVHDWPHVAVCHDCGLLWPCPGDLMRSALDHAEMEAQRRECAKCGRNLDRGRMAAQVGEDGNDDGPGAVWYCGRKGPCLTAARRAAKERGLVLERRHQWADWKSTVPFEEGADSADVRVQ